MKKKISYAVMYEINKENANFPKTLQELSIQIDKSERRKKIQKINKSNEK